MSSISTAYKTEKSLRTENEDSCLVLTSVDLHGGIDGLYILADGMGGRSSGKAASSIAVNTVRDEFVRQSEKGARDIKDILDKSLQAANAAVYNESHTNPSLHGMGTTCVAMAVKDDVAYFGHLGDSRAYFLRDGNIVRLTEDHSFVAEKVKSGELTEEQARNSRFRNVITRAVGLSPETEPEVGSISIKSGDILLLCSDGLTVPMSDDEIADILCTSETPGDACDKLVQAALKRGGRDNITVIVASCGVPVRIKNAPNLPAEKKRAGGWILPSLLGLLIGAGIGIYPGQMLVAKYAGSAAKISISAQADLSHISYSDPELLLSHIPLQGRIITIDRSDYLYIADLDGKLLRVDTSGRVDPKYPVRNTFRFFVPTHAPMIASDDQGNLYIADPAGRRILKFATNGSFIANIGVGKLVSPEALAVDRFGSIYVIDDGRLKVLRAKGQETTKK